MKFLKIAVFTVLTTFLFSCQEGSELSTSSIENKNIEVQYRGHSYSVEYQVEDNSVVSTSLPSDLKDLQSEDLYIIVNDNNQLELVDKIELHQNITRSESNPFDEYDAIFNIINADDFNHLGYATNDHETAYISYAKEFGIKGCWYEPQFRKVEYYDENEVFDYKGELLFGFNDGIQYEILEVSMDYDNIFTEFIRSGNTGLHHYGFGVKDIEAKKEALSAIGYEPILSGTFVTNSGVESNVAFIDTRSTLGVYTEIVEAKLLGFNVTQDQFLLITGLFLGDTKLKCLPH